MWSLGAVAPRALVLSAAVFLLALSYRIASPPSLKDPSEGHWRRIRGYTDGQGPWGSAGEDSGLPACKPDGAPRVASLGHEERQQQRMGLGISRPGMGPWIEGSVLRSAEEVLQFRGRWECIMTQHGSWVLNPTPRPIPALNKVQDISKNRFCRRLINNSDLAPLNAKVRKGLVSPSSWAVPDSLKYQWQVHPPGACGAPLGPRMPSPAISRADTRLLSTDSDPSLFSSSDSEDRIVAELGKSSAPSGAGADLMPFDGEVLCQTFERHQSRLHRSGEGTRTSQPGQGGLGGSLHSLPPLEVFVVGDSLSAAFVSSLEAQMKLTLGPQAVIQVPPEGRCAAYTRGVKRLPPKEANVGEQWYDKGHYIWLATHCATLEMCQRGRKGGRDERKGEGGDGEGGKVKGGGAGVRVHFGRSKHLSWLSATPDAKKLFREPWEKLSYAWADEMVERNASVVVLNTGAFSQPHAIFLERLNFTLSLLRQRLPHLLLIYRSTLSAHLKCTPFTSPILIPRSVCGAPYNWGEFAVQNKLARRIVEDVGGVWMDVFTMTELRPDWHPGPGDCLHYCAPGPIDTWVQLWMNMLQDLV